MEQLHVHSSELQLVTSSNEDVNQLMDRTLILCKYVIYALEGEKRKKAKKAMLESNELYQRFRDKRDYEVVPTLESIQINSLDLEQEYVQLIDYSNEITKSLKAITEATFQYKDNNHSAFSIEQIEDIKIIYKNLSDVYACYAIMDKTGDYSNFDQVTVMRENIIDLNSKMTKRQIKRVKENLSCTRSSILFLNLVKESKIITLQSSNLMKSHRNFKEQYAKSVASRDGKKMIVDTTLK